MLGCQEYVLSSSAIYTEHGTSVASFFLGSVVSEHEDSHVRHSLCSRHYQIFESRWLSLNSFGCLAYHSLPDQLFSFHYCPYLPRTSLSQHSRLVHRTTNLSANTTTSHHPNMDSALLITSMANPLQHLRSIRAEDLPPNQQFCKVCVTPWGYPIHADGPFE